MEVGILSGFWLATSAILIVSYFIDQHPSAPNFWRSLLRWGKMRVGFVVGSNYFYEVPKRWFQHFYMFGILVNSTVILLLFRKVYLGEPWPECLNWFLELLQYPSGRTGLTNAVPVLLTLTLELIQVSRRCYETLFVNVFSKAATMTLLHYVLGLVFYLSISLCVLTGADFHHLQLLGAISAVEGIMYAIALTIFISASVLQHQSFRILAALRTGDKGEESKKTQPAYPLPRGGLFEWVSCPHFLAEIIIYLSFCVVFQFQNVVVLSLFVFVLVNQVLAALLNHQWYCQNFPTACKNRFAVFPYLL